MNKNQLKLITSLLVAGSTLFSGQLWAHEELGSLGILAGAGATDLYEVICFTDPTEPSQKPTHQLYTSIRNDTVNGAIMSAQTMKITAAGNVYSTNITDPTPGDANPSPAAILSNGPDGDQVYFVTVNHTAKFAANYLLSYHCQDAQGVHTGTDIQVMQNQ